MRKTKPFLLVAAISLLTSSVTLADGEYFSKGIGNFSCTEYIAKFDFREDNTRLAIKEYAFGYATAMNVARKDTGHPTKSLQFLTGDLAHQEVRSYCALDGHGPVIAPAMKLIYDSLPASEKQ